MSGPALEPWTRPVEPGEALHLGDHGPLGHAPFRLTVEGARHVVVLPSDARVLRWQGMRLPEWLVVLEAPPSVILIRTDTLEAIDVWLHVTDVIGGRAGWNVLWGTSAVLLISEDGDVRHHVDGYGVAEPTAFDGAALSYTCDLFRKGRVVPLADLPPVPWHPLRGDRAA